MASKMKGSMKGTFGAKSAMKAAKGSSILVTPAKSPKTR